MRRIILAILAFTLYFANASAQWGISLNPSSLELYPNATYTLTVSMWNTIDNSLCTWESSDESVVTVENGVATGKALGEATITCSYTQTGGWGGGTYTATCDVKVVEPPTPLQEDELPFVPTTIVNGAFSAGTQWYLLSIRGGKYVYYDAEGSYNVACLSGAPEEGSESTQYLWCFTGNSTDGYRMYNYATGASILFSTKAVQNGNELRAMKKDELEDDPGLFQFYTNGNGGFNLTAASNHKACMNDFKDSNYLAYWVDNNAPYDNGSCIVFQEVSAEDYGGEPMGEVINETDIRLNVSAISLSTGTEYQLTATISPEDATYKRITWTSDNASVASVSDGLVKAKSIGTANITAKTHGGLTANCTVTVTRQIQETDTLGTIHYFTLSDGQTVAIPEKYIKNRKEEEGVVTLELVGDTTFCYSKNRLASEDTTYQGQLPVFESFKFNNKFNDQLNIDADGVIDNEQNTIDLQVGCIGKSLTASFKVPEGGHAYVDGVEQHSKVTRQRFDKDLTYTLAVPNNWIYKVRKLSDEVWSTPSPDVEVEEWLTEPVGLTADMITSNWFSQNESERSAALLDDDINTYFHSRWDSENDWVDGATYEDGTCTWPYLQVNLEEPIQNFQFGYTTRNWSSNGGYAPQGFIIQASKDGEIWETMQTLTAEKDNMPTGAAVSYESANILLGDAYAYLRFQLTASTRKNYLVLSEFHLNKLEQNPEYGKDVEEFVPELLVPAIYEHGFVPFGRDYQVHVDFLTDLSAAEYAVPTIRINTFDGTSITSKTRYWDASFELDGAGIWPDLKVDTMLIKGRGNSSWGGGYTKEPYRIKFLSKEKPFGLTKGKNWVLLANKQSGSMTSNAVAMKVADMVKSAGCNHIIPCELYINGEYRGSYNFTEKIGFSNNSISIDDETNAVMLELDSYYDESYRFKSAKYTQPVNVQSPDFTDPDEVTNLTFEDIESAFNAFEENVYYENYAEKENGAYMDVDAFCRAMLVTDLTRNTEVQHPKSWYLYNENILADSAWVFGPVWDFDWSFGYEDAHTYFISSAEKDLLTPYHNAGIAFFQQMLRSNEIVQKHYYRVWTEFLNKGHLDELVEYCDDYYDFVKPSFQHNATKWSDGNGYATTTANAKNWLVKRANYIYSNLTPFDLSEDIDDTPEDYDYGQPDRVDIAKVMNQTVDVFTLQGIRMRTQVPYAHFSEGLMPGVYVVGGKKIIVR